MEIDFVPDTPLLKLSYQADFATDDGTIITRGETDGVLFDYESCLVL